MVCVCVCGEGGVEWTYGEVVSDRVGIVFHGRGFLHPAHPVHKKDPHTDFQPTLTLSESSVQPSEPWQHKLPQQ